MWLKSKVSTGWGHFLSVFFMPWLEESKGSAHCVNIMMSRGLNCKTDHLLSGLLEPLLIFLFTVHVSVLATDRRKIKRDMYDSTPIRY